MLEELFCKRVRPWFSERLDGAPVPLLWRPPVALHLAVCPLCKRTYQSLEETKRVAEASGFGSEDSLQRAFRAVLNATPDAIRSGFAVAEIRSGETRR